MTTTRKGRPRKPQGRGTAKAQSVAVANDIASGRRHWIEHDDKGNRKPLPADATPLDVMLMAMRRAYELYGSLAAADYAEKAAPYLHAKMSPAEPVRPVQPPTKLVFVWGDETDGISGPATGTEDGFKAVKH